MNDDEEERERGGRKVGWIQREREEMRTNHSLGSEVPPRIVTSLPGRGITYDVPFGLELCL